MSRLEARARQVGTRPTTIVNRWIARIEGDLLRLVGLRLTKNTKLRIRVSKRSPDGSKWSKRKDSNPWPLLYHEHTLHDSVKPRRIDRRTVAVTAEAPYAKFQNARRRFLGVSTVDIGDVESNVIAPWVRKNLK